MKIRYALILAALTVPVIGIAAEPSTELCSDIKWSADFLKDYPKAPAACRQVVVKNGMKYAQFDGHVKKVGNDVVEVEIHNVANTAISEIGFQVGVGGTVNLNGKTVKVKDLKNGDLLTFWVPEGVYGLSPNIAERPLKIVKPSAL